MNLKKWSIDLSLLVFLFFISCQNESIKDTIQILAKTEIGLEPELFAAEFISKSNRSEFGSVFSKNNKEFFFAVDSNGVSKMYVSLFENNMWTNPVMLFSDDSTSYNDPFLSPDEERLYYISNAKRNTQDTIKDIDIFYSIRKDNGWSEPINAGTNINSDKNEYYISFSNEGTMYFASNKTAEKDRNHDFDIYSSEYKNGEFQQANKLSDSINTKRYEADVFVDPNENYIIFCAARADGMGKGDLYISYKNEDKKWMKAKNMGSLINSKNHELCPFVTNDGKYFFYTSNQDIYWVDASILEKYK